ncbi:MAG: type II toxin-antitoxin system VapC family toxin [Candidatus Firestonebacteria bacterium]
MREEIADYGPRYLVDTDIIINQIRNKDTKMFLDLCKSGILHISVLTEYELFYGILNEKMREEVENFLSFFKKINITSDICRKAAEIKQKNKQIELVDLLIASTCYVYKMILVTGNKKHFKIIPEIEIYEKEK